MYTENHGIIHILTSDRPHLNAGNANINITGHQTPLIVGQQRNITCTWSEGNAATMEWYLVGVTSAIVSKSNTNTTILPLDIASGLDGNCFICRVTTSNGEQFEEFATLTVKGE